MLITISCNQYIHAGVWKSIGECFKNPCNCGQKNDIIEEYGDKEINRGKGELLCPPYVTKRSGRTIPSCLYQSTLPGISAFRNYVCAQSIRGINYGENYFTPSAMLKQQLCMGVACVSKNYFLQNNGDCKILPGPTGYPVKRICGRVAFGADRDYTTLDNEAITEADYGYTTGVHLNEIGQTVKDPVIRDFDGKEIKFTPIKYCLYEDPSFLDLFAGKLDLLDIKLHYQPMHKTNEVHWLIRIIVTAMETFVSARSNLGDFIADLIKKIDFLGPIADAFGSMLKFMGELMNILPELFIKILREVGKLNREVGKSLGCTNLGIGPFPPPYCDDITEVFPEPDLLAICPKKESSSEENVDETIDSNGVKPCVAGAKGVFNNAISNSVRVGYNHYVPLCADENEWQKSDKCVVIEGKGPVDVGSAQVLHESTKKLDVLPRCNNDASNAPCVRAHEKLKGCTNKSGLCADNDFRIAYTTRISPSDSLAKPRSFYIDGSITSVDDAGESHSIKSLPDCSPSVAGQCQAVWGVNTGNFVDVTLNFPEVQDQNNLQALEKEVVIDSKTSDKFKVKIYSNITEILDGEGYSFYTDPDDICVYDNVGPLSCIKRMPHPRPLIYECENIPDYLQGKLSCTNTYKEPGMVVSLKQNGKYSSTVIKPLTYEQQQNNPNGEIEDTFTLANTEFNYFITDDDFIKKPFKGPRAITNTSIYGHYKDGQKPFDVNNEYEDNKNAVYLYGLEYVNNSYLRGGSKLCMEYKESQVCPDDKEMCVLTKLKNSDILDCKEYASKMSSSLAGELVPCDGDAKNCVNEFSMTDKNNSKFDVYKCKKDDYPLYCYKHPNMETLSKGICTVSYDAKDRIVPQVNAGLVLNDEQYFDIDKTYPEDIVEYESNSTEQNEKEKGRNTHTGADYNKSKFGLRNKTAYEMNLCVAIPEPKCKAITEPSLVDGNATWEEVKIGRRAKGKCATGYNRIGDLKPISEPWSLIADILNNIIQIYRDVDIVYDVYSIVDALSVQRYCMGNDEANVSFEDIAEIEVNTEKELIRMPIGGCMQWDRDQVKKIWNLLGPKLSQLITEFPEGGDVDMKNKLADAVDAIEFWLDTGKNLGDLDPYYLCPGITENNFKWKPVDMSRSERLGGLELLYGYNVEQEGTCVYDEKIKAKRQCIFFTMLKAIQSGHHARGADWQPWAWMYNPAPPRCINPYANTCYSTEKYGATWEEVTLDPDENSREAKGTCIEKGAKAFLNKIECKRNSEGVAQFDWPNISEVHKYDCIPETVNRTCESIEVRGVTYPKTTVPSGQNSINVNGICSNSEQNTRPLPCFFNKESGKAEWARVPIYPDDSNGDPEYYERVYHQCFDNNNTSYAQAKCPMLKIGSGEMKYIKGKMRMLCNQEGYHVQSAPSCNKSEETYIDPDSDLERNLQETGDIHYGNLCMKRAVCKEKKGKGMLWKETSVSKIDDNNVSFGTCIQEGAIPQKNELQCKLNPLNENEAEWEKLTSEHGCRLKCPDKYSKDGSVKWEGYLNFLNEELLDPIDFQGTCTDKNKKPQSDNMRLTCYQDTDNPDELIWEEPRTDQLCK